MMGLLSWLFPPKAEPCRSCVRKYMTYTMSGKEAGTDTLRCEEDLNHGGVHTGHFSSQAGGGLVVWTDAEAVGFAEDD